MQGLVEKFNNLTSGFRPLDQKSAYVHNYIKNNNKHLRRLKDVMEGYIRNLERIKKKTVKKRMYLAQYAEKEDSTFQTMLIDFSEMLLEKEIAQEDLINRVEEMCHKPLKMYGTLCKNLYEEVRNRDLAVAKEQNKQQELDRVIMKDAGNAPRRNQSQMELAGATHAVTHATDRLIENAEQFEKTKRDDIKKILSELLWSEIKYHARVLEILSEHHQLLGEVEFADDIKLVEKMKAFVPTSPLRSPLSPLTPF
ncbi:hypothetical protein HDU79_009491 [Rhizoclosmatium sp. JEL0117]|nr:hypothetical protein HDU79_009491 [Rhizoclosmatium sp. JEL0117]